MAVLLGAFFCAAAAPNNAAQDWPGWGNGPSYQRFAPADQINASNVNQLKPVWKYTIAQKGYWEITPIVVEGVMYLQDMQGNAIALDPETGRELWRFSSGQPARMRSLSYWPGDAAHGPRLVMGASDRIYALDIATHQPSPGLAAHAAISISAKASPSPKCAMRSPRRPRSTRI